MEIIGKLDYNINESGYDSADFTANFNLDFFYCTKNAANRLLEKRKNEIKIPTSH